MLTDLLFGASTSLGVALFDERASVVLPANADLRAVNSALAVKDV